MMVIYGRRSFGRIDAHGGEHAHTSFVHLYFMPLVPIGSFWVTEDLGTTVRGFDIRPSGKSIAAAYLRCWGPLAGLIAFSAASGMFRLIAALPFVALTVLAWSWRSLRGDARRRSDFQLLAFGTRCDPERMPNDLRQKVKATLEDHWRKLDPGRPPDDVARFGPRSSNEAVFAYGLLRLAGDSTAARILEGVHDAPPVGDSPYRGGEAAASADAAGLLQDVAAAVARRSTPAASGPWWRYTRGKAAIALFLGLAAIGGVIEEGASLTAPRYRAAELAYRPELGRTIEVHCDRIEPYGALGDAPKACVIEGKRLLVDGRIEGTEIYGRLRRFADAETGDVLPVYLEATSPSKGAAIGCIATLVVLLGLGLFWLRARRQRS